MIDQAIYERLRQAARDHALVYYEEIAALLALNPDHDADRAQLGRLLMAVSRCEHEQGHPLLSVVVVNRGSQLPNKGFFYAARELGRYEGSSAAEMVAFFTDELKAVYAYWSENHDD